MVVLPTGVDYRRCVKNNLSMLGTQTREIVTERDDVAQTETCSICGVVFMKWGHNAAPITDGRCCDECNNLVVARRIELATNQLEPGTQWQQLVDRIGEAAAIKVGKNGWLNA